MQGCWPATPQSSVRASIAHTLLAIVCRSAGNVRCAANGKYNSHVACLIYTYMVAVPPASPNLAKIIADQEHEEAQASERRQPMDLCLSLSACICPCHTHIPSHPLVVHPALRRLQEAECICIWPAPLTRDAWESSRLRLQVGEALRSRILLAFCAVSQREFRINQGLWKARRNCRPSITKALSWTRGNQALEESPCQHNSWSPFAYRYTKFATSWYTFEDTLASYNTHHDSRNRAAVMAGQTIHPSQDPILHLVPWAPHLLVHIWMVQASSRQSTGAAQYLEI